MAPRDHGTGAFADFQYYYYTPSMAAAIIFVCLFAVSTALHLFQMIKTHTWFMIPFCLGGLFEIIGYCGRVGSSAEAPNFSLGPYIIQATFLLVAPTLLAASIYMELARIVLMVDGDRALFIRRTWLTKIFVGGDIFCFLMQAAGSSLQVMSSVKTGELVVMASLGLQLLFFFLFILASAIFHFRMRRSLTPRCTQLPWQKHMWSLYTVGVLIFVRCVMRLIEYGQGWHGYILSHEVFLYIFDSVPMFLAMVTMNWVHPSEVAALIREQSKIAASPVHMREV